MLVGWRATVVVAQDVDLVGTLVPVPPSTAAPVPLRLSALRQHDMVFGRDDSCDVVIAGSKRSGCVCLFCVAIGLDLDSVRAVQCGPLVRTPANGLSSVNRIASTLHAHAGRGAFGWCGRQSQGGGLHHSILFGFFAFPNTVARTSSRHFSLRLLFDMTLGIVDMSKNGTFVNGERMDAGGLRLLHNRDVISLVVPSAAHLPSHAGVDALYVAYRFEVGDGTY